MLTQEQLLDLFEYKDGLLYHKSNNQVAGWKNKKGYYKLKIKEKAYFVHRIIFTMHTGLNPEIVDHIDRNPSNNIFENLRAATRQQNNSNSGIRKDNTSGVKGVTWHNNRWDVRVGFNKKRIHLGCFEDLELAELVAEMGREKYHGAFACNGNKD